MRQSIVHITNSHGHRGSYRDLFASHLGFVPSTGPILRLRFWQLVRAHRVLFATIDDDYVGFILVAAFRSALGKKTCGLFLRPLQCFSSGRPIVYPLKQKVFSAILRLPKLTLFSIIPHNIRPRLREVSHDWIYDPQLWDLWTDRSALELPETPLSRKVESIRGDRQILIFIGAANNIKGFPELVKSIEHDTKNLQRLLVVIAGQVEASNRAGADRLLNAGMIVEDRYITDEEILSLYGIADFAWCRYHSDYDQASGVFGRAVQTCVTPIVREKSVIAAICHDLNLEHTHTLLSAMNGRRLSKYEVEILIEGMSQSSHLKIETSLL